MSGPGSGYVFPTGADQLIVLADETALPAVTQLLTAAPADLQLAIHIEIVREDAALDLPLREGDSLEWHVTERGQVPGRRIVGVIEAVGELVDGTDVWAAGEASAMHAIRHHLFDDLGVDRKRATVRGYWKPAR
jgi:NADPH-dependent ferric siderophore reductase